MLRVFNDFLDDGVQTNTDLVVPINSEDNIYNLPSPITGSVLVNPAYNGFFYAVNGVWNAISGFYGTESITIPPNSNFTLVDTSVDLLVQNVAGIVTVSGTFEIAYGNNVSNGNTVIIPMPFVPVTEPIAGIIVANNGTTFITGSVSINDDSSAALVFQPNSGSSSNFSVNFYFSYTNFAFNL